MKLTLYTNILIIVNDNDADLLMKSIVHMIKDIPADVTIQEADSYQIIKKFIAIHYTIFSININSATIFSIIYHYYF